MKRDIRDLFKDEVKLKPLPEHHSIDFQEKLKLLPKEETNNYILLKVAAVLVIGLVISYSLYRNSNLLNEDSLIAEMKVIETEYLKDIEVEWQKFVLIANDEHLVQRYQKNLDELQADYYNISKYFNEEPNNVMVLEHLIENLQRRLQLLKNIQEHINILNQKNEQYENTI